MGAGHSSKGRQLSLYLIWGIISCDTYTVGISYINSCSYQKDSLKFHNNQRISR